MSPIFNQTALHGLSSSTLGSLRVALRHALGADALTASECAALHAALRSIEAILCSRAAEPKPPGPAPSP